MSAFLVPVIASVVAITFFTWAFYDHRSGNDPLGVSVKIFIATLGFAAIFRDAGHFGPVVQAVLIGVGTIATLRYYRTRLKKK